MPQFYLRISVLVHTCMVSSNVKKEPGSKVNGMSVLCFVLLEFVSYTVLCKILG